MKKMEDLTPEQESKLQDYVEKWINIGLSITPADHSKAESAMTAAYKNAGLKAPAFIWLGSPLAGALAAAEITGPAKVWAKVGDKVWDKVGAKVGDKVRDKVGAKVWAKVGAKVGDKVWDKVGAKVGDKVWDKVGANTGYGQQEAGWFSFYDFFIRETDINIGEISPLLNLAENCSWYFPYEGVCILTEKPTSIHTDSEGRLHNPLGPAISYPDGFALYYVNGEEVDEIQIKMNAFILDDRRQQ